MRKNLIAFGIRLVVTGALSILLGVTAVLPLPPVFWPACLALLYPVAWFWEAVGRDVFIHPPESPVILAWLALPVYLGASYLPQVGWWVGKRVHRLTRVCLRMPNEFTLYFVAGTVLGSLLGSFAGLRAGLLWPEWGMLSCVLVTATVSGWSLAVLRCRSGMEA